MSPLVRLPRASLCLFVGLIAGACSVGGPTSPRVSPTQEGSGAELPQNRVGLFGGVTGLSDGTTSMSLGLEYERRFSQLWGLGAVLEFTPALEERTVTAPQVFLHPWRSIFVNAALGLVFDDGRGHPMLRIGAGWEQDLGGGWSLAPQFDLDLVDDADNALVLGVALSRWF